MGSNWRGANRREIKRSSVGAICGHQIKDPSDVIRLITTTASIVHNRAINSNIRCRLSITAIYLPNSCRGCDVVGRKVTSQTPPFALSLAREKGPATLFFWAQHNI